MPRLPAPQPTNPLPRFALRRAGLSQSSDVPRRLRASRRGPAPPRSYRPLRSWRPRWQTGGPRSSRGPSESIRSSAASPAPPLRPRARSALRGSCVEADRQRLTRPAEEAQASDAAIRVDVQPDVRDVADRADFVLEHIAPVRLQRRARHQRDPPLHPGVAATLETARARRVPLEVTRVHLDAPYGSDSAQTHARPVVTGAAPALRFPAVAHVRRVARHDQVVTRTIEHVAACDDEATMLRRGQVDIAAAREPRPIGHDVAVNTKPRDAAIRENAQPQMR